MVLSGRNEWFLLSLSLTALIPSLSFPYEILHLLIGTTVITGTVLAGIWMAKRINLPVFGLKKRSPLAEIFKSILFGFLIGLMIIITMKYLIAPVEPKILQRFQRDAQLPMWQWLLVVFHAPVLEEILFRLFFLTLFAFLMTKISKKKMLSDKRLWSANLLAAFFFAAGHLPPWLQQTHPTFGLLAAVIMINLVAALLFGYYYMKRGIQFAILSHMGADVGVHIIPMLAFSF
jgi:membrane protease YdiL (CAAX protease family)